MGNDARDQTASFGLVGFHHASGQAHFHRLGLSDKARQALGAARTG